MLILTRRTNESLVIGEKADISITVLDIRGRQVCLGINAPKDVRVNRDEIHRRILEERAKQEKDQKDKSDKHKKNFAKKDDTENEET